MTGNKKTDLASKRAALMSGEGPGVDRFKLAASVTDSRSTGTGPWTHSTPSSAPVSEPGDSVIKVVSVEEVIENPLNARHAYQEKRVNDLAASMYCHFWRARPWVKRFAVWWAICPALGTSLSVVTIARKHWASSGVRSSSRCCQ